MRTNVVALAVVLVVSAAVAPRARADDDTNTVEARRLYAKGIDLVKASQWGEALSAFERSSKLRPHPATTYVIGTCERALGRYTRARATFAAALADGTAGGLPPSLQTDAKAYVDEIDRLLAHAKVDVDPADAGIALDGRPLVPEAADKGTLVAGIAPPGPGTTPPSPHFDLLLDPGPHVITLSRKGYSDIVLNRTFAPGTKTELKLELERLPAHIHVTSNEPNGLVMLNSTDLGPTPADVLRPAGAYHVTVKKDGYETYEAQIAVKPGEEVNLQATLVEHHTPVTKRWWFWTGAAAVVAGGVVLTYALTRPSPQPPPYEGGTTGWVVNPAAR